MAGTFTNNGDGTFTISFEYTAETDKAQAVIDNAAELLFKEKLLTGELDGSAVFDNLTNQERLDMVDVFVRQNVMRIARNNLIDIAVDSAREAALADNSIDLG